MKTFLSLEINLCLISPHLLEDGEVDIDLLDTLVLLLEVEGEEELSCVTSPELTELKLLLTFSRISEAPARTTGDNLETKVSTTVVEHRGGGLV